VDIMNKYGHNTPATWNAAMESVLTDAVSNIVKNKVDPLATLNTAADKCNTELQKILS
jgi:multiple sugar transport system substrate-binding protein